MHPRHVISLLSLAVVLGLTAGSLSAQSEEEIRAKFLYRSHTYVTSVGDTITRPYRLFIPDGYDPNVVYPLVLALHGLSESGDDNELQISLYRLATSWADTLNQRRHPAFVVAPQAPVFSSENPYYQETNGAKHTYSLLDSLVTEFSVDVDRIYVTGFSMGGFFTWLAIMERPDLFAAAVPLSAAPEPSGAENLTNLPIWVLHGQSDPNAEDSRAWIREFSRLGLDPLFLDCDLDGDCFAVPDCSRRKAVEHRQLIYTEYEGEDHFIGTRTYDDPILIDWVYSQRRGQQRMGRVGSTITLDVDMTDVLAQQPGRSVGIVGSQPPLEWDTPFPVCEEIAENVYGASIAFAETTTGTLDYRFVHFDSEGGNKVEESVDGGVRSTVLSGDSQLLPLVYWNDVDGPAPGSPVLSSPLSGVVLKENPRLLWTPEEPVGRYEVQTDTSESFASSALTETRLRLPGLRLSDVDTLTTYYWRVRAVNGAGSSPWAGPWSFFKMGSTPILVAPADKAVTDSSSSAVVLEWEAYPGVSRYEVGVSTEPDFSQVDLRVVTGTSFTFGPLASLTTYYWRVRWMFAGPWSPARSFTTPRIVGVGEGLVPRHFQLSQNYPNPFNPTTTIKYDLPVGGAVALTVYDVLGRQVKRLDIEKPPGYHSLVVDASTLASGMYLYRLEAGDFTATRQMVVLK